MTVEEITGKVEMLSDVSPDILKKHMNNGYIYTRLHTKNVTVHSQGDVCSVLDIVISGNLAAYALSENGSAVTMFEFGEGSVIGANLLFGDNHAYPFNIYTASGCLLLHISTESVVELLCEQAFVMQFIRSLSQNAQGMNRKIVMLTQKTLRENILDYLRQQSIIQESSDIMLPISKKELADALGVQRPSLFREFKRLQEDGIIAVNNRFIKILKPI